MPQTLLHVLVDNRSADPRLEFEHGWSVLIDLGERGQWLWDTGQTGLFLDNAHRLGLDPLTVSGVALSHGHHDHAGGLPILLQAGYAGPLIGHPGIMARRYCRRDGSTYRSIGMGDGRLPAPPPGFEPVTDIRELAPGLTFVTGIPHRPGTFTATANFFCDTAGHIPDPIPDDACLVIDGRDGPVLLLGCCHAGLGNTLAHVRQRLGLARIHTVIGGLHLREAPEWALAETLDALTACRVQRIFPGHCTGEAGCSRLQRDFPGQTSITGAGLRLAV